MGLSKEHNDAKAMEEEVVVKQKSKQVSLSITFLHSISVSEYWMLLFHLLCSAPALQNDSEITMAMLVWISYSFIETKLLTKIGLSAH